VNTADLADLEAFALAVRRMRDLQIAADRGDIRTHSRDRENSELAVDRFLRERLTPCFFTPPDLPKESAQ
jgi:hypothetical protein